MAEGPSDCAQAHRATPPGLTRTGAASLERGIDRARGAGLNRAGFLLCNRMRCEIP